MEDGAIVKPGPAKAAQMPAVASLRPRAHQPRMGAMLVTQVSSMKTRKTRPGRINPRLIFFPTRAAARHRGGLARPAARFFEAHSLAMDEIPDRAIADGNAAFGEFRHEPAHGRDPLHEPAPFSHESAGPMAPHLPTRGAVRLPKPLRPAHHTRHAHREDRGNGAHAVSRTPGFRYPRR